jgi:hypothetical protein
MTTEIASSDDVAVPEESPKHAVVSVALHAARIEIAAVTAIGKLLAGWAHAADHYAQEVGDELLRRVAGESASSELVVRLAAATSSHLREVTALPTVAVAHFSGELARATTPPSRLGVGETSHNK